MAIITLADGQQKQFSSAVTVLEVAASISNSLKKAALAGTVDGKMVDLDHTITTDATVCIVTAKDQAGLEILRHSCAHLMAQAVQELFPTAQVTIGPVIEDGFYYDFAYERAFTPEDLVAIETKMRELITRKLVIKRTVMERAAAISYFEKQGEKYKVEIIKDIPADQELSFYQQGEFVDLCRGPHIPDTGKIGAFKLLKVAGAYWRGDANNEMLQRIYGTAWANKKDLAAYLFRIEEAQKRDHRKLAKKYDLFHLQEEAPGMVFWHPKGWSVVKLIKEYISDKLTEHNYQEINTPQLVDLTLWQKSGHWEAFQDEMFTVSCSEHDTTQYAIKPMNCPCHVQVFNQGVKSYRDLPLRLAEFGSCHRSEPSGALHGLMRLRNFVQDDAHIFCTEEQIQAEVTAFTKLLFVVYADFGFDDILVRLSTRPDKRVGSDEIWDKAEQALATSLQELALEHEVLPGEGAFYGPKIEFSLKDCLGRIWQCGTMQIDFSMPARLGAHYVAEDGTRCVPVMLHRAILGSIERFVGILLEETAGSLPLWLAPVQAVVLNITDEQVAYVVKITKLLREHGFRVVEDLRNEKIGFKIREHTIQRVPYLLVVGAREVTDETISVRTREGKDLGSMSLEKLLNELTENVKMLGRRMSLALEKNSVTA